MKKLFVSLLGFCMLATIGMGQDAEKNMKKAGKLLGSYYMNPSNNQDKLAEAKSLIDDAMVSGELDGSADAWTTKGKIYNELATQEAGKLAAGLEVQVTDAGLQSFGAYEKALGLSEKARDKKEALKGMAELSNTLNNLGFSMYQNDDFLNAFKHFDGVLQVNKMLKQNDAKPILKDRKAESDQMYIAGVAALSAGQMDGVKRYFSILKDLKEFEMKPVIFSGLYQAYKDEDPEKALTFLEEGRKAFPDDSSLLFAEINHYLSIGELESLIGKLEDAAKLEPNNASIRTTLGNVYDQQYQEALEGDDREREQMLFNKAYENYQEALKIDAKDFSAMYSLGALYYNKAASMTRKVNELAEDYSKEGTAKYEAAKAEMNDLFGEALPYFEKAEQMNATDRNTLIALKEIYARQNNFDKSNAYKAKIDALGE